MKEILSSKYEDVVLDQDRREELLQGLKKNFRTVQQSKAFGTRTEVLEKCNERCQSAQSETCYSTKIIELITHCNFCALPENRKKRKMKFAMIENYNERQN